MIVGVISSLAIILLKKRELAAAVTFLTQCPRSINCQILVKVVVHKHNMLRKIKVFALCQEDSPERMISPQGGSFKVVPERIYEFLKLSYLINTIDVDRLTRDCGIITTLIKQSQMA